MRYIIVVIVLLIVWVGTFYIITNYAEELRNHPCTSCAKKIGDDVMCYSGNNKMIFTKEGVVEVDWDRTMS